ncbi:MAG: type III pantothenate kinase [Muribaculaceae bacterium]|nr:type III pantothenate kinase [Muribaculaceae bacterium]
MNTLTIDIGNNKIKLDYWDNDGILYRTLCDKISMEEIKREVENIDIKGIILSSVRKDYQDIIQALKEQSGCDVIIDFNQDEIDKISDKIKYKGKVGPDRIAAYLGAQAQVFGPKLIIDAGTAITLDIADKEGCYRGGNISLGLKSRLKALADATSMLPKVEEFTTFSYFGRDTHSAIEDGARNGVIGEILYTIELAKLEYQIEWVVITGGDAENFFRTIRDKWEKCIPDKFLVGRGLNYHLRKFYFPDVFLHTNFQQSI